MSTVESLLKSAINPLVSGGCHNVINRSASIDLPYVVFYEISGLPETGINADYLGKTKYRYQVDTFAKTIEEAKALATGAIKSAIVAATDGVLVFQMNGQYNEKDKTFQYITEYQIWAE